MGAFEDQQEGREFSVRCFDPDEGVRRFRKKKSRAGSNRVCQKRDDASAEPPEASKPKEDAFARIVALSTVRDRSSGELVKRLGNEGYDAKDIDESIARAQRCGLVDDERFADAFVRGRIRAGKGEKAIARDLATHGLSLDDLSGWPDDYGMGWDAQVQRACDFLAAHPSTARDPYAAARRKLEARGYRADVAHAAAKAWMGTLEGKDAS